jgi:hypothetical protein
MPRHPRLSLLLTAGALFLALGAAPARADDRPLKSGQEEIELNFGHGFDADTRKERVAVPFHTFVPGYGKFISPRREILFELPIGFYYTPEDAVSVGFDVLLRQHFARFGRLSPFFEIGGGGLWTDLNDGNLGGTLQFILNAGLGFRYVLSRQDSLTVSGRFHHLSNGGLNSPNRGLNDVVVLVGYTRFLH